MLTSVYANMHKLDDTIGRLDTREKNAQHYPSPLLARTLALTATLDGLHYKFGADCTL